MSGLVGSATAVYVLAHEIAAETGCSREKGREVVLEAFRKIAKNYPPDTVEGILVDLDALKVDARSRLIFEQRMQIEHDKRPTIDMQGDKT